ncbi:GA-binding protein subunit beta-1-like [Littorina saxatilis]|uniref:GA-binding protein subunit beta-1-like n=1 Tax=Littorina saxatilis TaxID=31220 RepID=UPI0038B471E8
MHAGVDVNARMGQPEGLPAGCTLLHIAANRQDKKIVDYLLQHGAEINARDSLGRTPLFYAKRVGNKEAAKLLMECGATVYSEVVAVNVTRPSKIIIIITINIVIISSIVSPTSSSNSNNKKGFIVSNSNSNITSSDSINDITLADTEAPNIPSLLSPMSSSAKTPLSATSSTPLLATSSTPLSATSSTPLSATSSTPLSATSSTPLSATSSAQIGCRIVAC